MEELNNDLALLRASTLFDEAWYKKQYRDVETLGIDPADHFLRFGAQLKRNPSPFFDTAYYLTANPDVAAAMMNPLVHYLRFGRREGRAAAPPSQDEGNAAVPQDAVAAGPIEPGIYRSRDSGRAAAAAKLAVLAEVADAAACERLAGMLADVETPPALFVLVPPEAIGQLAPWLSTSLPGATVLETAPGARDADLRRLAAQLVEEGHELVCCLPVQGAPAVRRTLAASLALPGTVTTAFAGNPGLAFIRPAAAVHAEGGAGWARAAFFRTALEQLAEGEGLDHCFGRVAAAGSSTIGLIQRCGIASRDFVIDLRAGSSLALAAGASAGGDEDGIEASFRLIQGLAVFDQAFYMRQTTEPARLGMGPLYHYLLCGEAQDLDPAPWFSTALYRTLHRAALGEGKPFHHYLSAPDGERPAAFPTQSSYDLIAEILRKDGSFDGDYYLEMNPDVRAARMDPLQHFCRHGWAELRRPNPHFDTWWYGITHLGELDGVLNPLLHYTLVGRAAGMPTAPDRGRQNRIGTGLRYDRPAGAVKRICLYAGHDADGAIDPCVLDYLKALSQFADIYYFSDAEMEAQELAKLGPYVKDAWALRHQARDFGSFSLLATTCVGWDLIDQYDELILANDSCYLVGDFAPVFERMHERQCDWWGLQATKGLPANPPLASVQFREKIPLATIKESMLSSFEDDYRYDFHLGPYFLCCRKPVMGDAGFRRLLGSVKEESNGKLFAQRYQVGLSKYLINAGFEFDAFIDELYPLDPTLAMTHFELIGRGFPLLKRELLSENHYRIPELHHWKEWLLDVAPDAPVETIENNLYRCVDNEKLFASLCVDAEGRTQQELMLSNADIESVDAHLPKNDNWWVFPVCAYNHTLGGNERAVFESVRHDPAIKKIILTRSRHIDLDGENVVIAPIRSVPGQQFLLRSKVVFLKHSPTLNAVYPLRPDLRHFINLWHGIPLKRIGAASLDLQGNLQYVYSEHRRCRSVIASSRIDQMAMASAFYPLTYNDVWVTGLPRNDFVVCAEEKLPADMMRDVASIRAMLGGRRLVFYAPTFRNPGPDSYYSFSEAEKRRLKELLKRNNCVLGIREHLADKTRSYSAALREIGAIDLGDRKFSNIEVIYRCADVLVTDYSSSFIDYMLTGKPVFSFAYDFERYISSERGLFYDMEMVFPGPICRSFDVLAENLERTLAAPRQEPDERYRAARSIFFDYLDDKNSERLIARVKSL
jgi:CDP-glycerol glycerophosphotransferase (TagB/SpsB family)